MTNLDPRSSPDDAVFREKVPDAKAGRTGAVLVDFSNTQEASMKFGTIGARAVALAFAQAGPGDWP